MLKPNLAGLTILVTRPQPQGEILCDHIRVAGGQAIYLPTIEIIPPADPALFQQQVGALDQQDWLIFISPQAVYQSAPIITATWPNFPLQLKVAAVGKGTAEACQEMNLPLPVYPVDWCSEGLLGLPIFKTVAGKKIALLRGAGGRELLTAELARRGAILSHLIAYRRCLPNVDIQEYTYLIHHHKIDIIVCTSNEILQNLKTLIGAPAWSDLRRIPLVVVSQRMLTFANKLGFKNNFLAENARHAAIMAVLATKKDHLCQMKKKKR